ncbi:regulatory protein RecX [Saccharicrinis fermentans]|uniref:Regulatory protein RecX n=1 Tax=Saccharicrinis fermentans DSM 9555 = JCM 21142 TaxID=869213 RepID=W7YIB4_9BACT|nr:regulatory protein RecX [Saccharicrinis fermentans]GAF04216.1 recombination regulator RecX [Saccharicrinis fermentans DSM 9555 = JCM 21142]
MTFEQALLKASHICARQEKCIFDIQKKLNDWQVEPNIAQRVIDQLIKEKFIDEERYIRFYVKDKFLFNRWGKIKIRWQLKAKQISGKQVDTALEQINMGEYRQALAQLLIQKKRSIKNDDPFKTKASLIRYASSRGFEPPLIYQILDNEVMSDNK